MFTVQDIRRALTEHQKKKKKGKGHEQHKSQKEKWPVNTVLSTASESGLGGVVGGKLLSFTADQNKICIAFSEANVEICTKSLKRQSFDLTNNLLEVILKKL